jgi:hypothetical protein
VHQIGLKNFDSQNFSFLDFKGEVLGVTQISSSATGAGMEIKSFPKLCMEVRTRFICNFGLDLGPGF